MITRTGHVIAALALLTALACAKKPAADAPADAPAAPNALTKDAYSVRVAPSSAIPVLRVAKLGSDNPRDDAWKEAPYVEAAMMPQMMTMPKLDVGTISLLRAQARTDGEKVAWRLTWADDTPSGNVDTGRFTDAVGLEFPLAPDASPFMGTPGKPVLLLHWKALWQKDIDTHFQDVPDLHPNMWVDLYWFAEGKSPFKVPESFKNPLSLQWFIALQAGNPMAAISRTTPVEEAVAEGFGTLTHGKGGKTTAKGAWADGLWSVVFTRPAAGPDVIIKPGAKGQVAFAVWDGSAGNVGGRKHWSNWTSYEMAP